MTKFIAITDMNLVALKCSTNRPQNDYCKSTINCLSSTSHRTKKLFIKRYSLVESKQDFNLLNSYRLGAASLSLKPLGQMTLFITKNDILSITALSIMTQQNDIKHNNKK